MSDNWLIVGGVSTVMLLTAPIVLGIGLLLGQLLGGLSLYNTSPLVSILVALVGVMYVLCPAGVYTAEKYKE